MDKEQVRKLYCKWCPQEDACKENFTEEEMMGYLACGGFADDLDALFPQGDDEGLLTVEEMGFIWGNCDPQTEISKRCLNIAKAQLDLTRQENSEKLYNQTMQAKKSGWDDAVEFYRQERLDRLDREKMLVDFTSFLSFKLGIYMGEGLFKDYPDKFNLMIPELARELSDHILALIPDEEEIRKRIIDFIEAFEVFTNYSGDFKAVLLSELKGQSLKKGE